MNPTVEKMLEDNARYGWPDPHYHQQQYEQAMDRAHLDNPQWVKEELIKYPSLKD